MAEPKIPLPSEGASGVKEDGTATATCFCGAVQLAFVSPLYGLELPLIGASTDFASSLSRARTL